MKLIIITNFPYRYYSSYQAASRFLPIVAYNRAAPETDLAGHPCYIVWASDNVVK
jgi:hypothetical protein